MEKDGAWLFVSAVDVVVDGDDDDDDDKEEEEDDADSDDMECGSGGEGSALERSNRVVPVGLLLLVGSSGSSRVDLRPVWL